MEKNKETELKAKIALQDLNYRTKLIEQATQPRRRILSVSIVFIIAMLAVLLTFIFDMEFDPFSLFMLLIIFNSIETQRTYSRIDALVTLLRYLK